MTNEVKAPDISYKNLTSDEAPYTGHKGHKAYNDDLIIRAVRQGIASDGRILIHQCLGGLLKMMI